MNLIQELGRLGVKWRPHGTKSDEVFVCCPFCHERGQSSDTRFRLGINVETGWAHCFNCDWRSRMGWGQILQAYGGRATKQDLNGASGYESTRGAAGDEWRRGWIDLATAAGDWEERARRYLERRGIGQSKLAELGVSVTYDGPLAYRILFPLRRHNRIVGVIARDYTGQRQPRYLTMGQRVLFNSPSSCKRLIIAEGVFKALRIGAAVQQPTVAILGSSITEGQVTQLQEIGVRKVILWPDLDPPGRSGGARCAKSLAEAGIALSAIVHCRVPADEADLELLRGAWRARRRFTWAEQQRLLLCNDAD